MIFILISILAIFTCFFLLFLLSKQDFVLLRQNISLSEMFDAAIVVFLFALLSGRVFYILDTFNFELLHALRFFYITRFPGVSMLGFFLGGALAVRFLFRNKKGLRRIYDIFGISFLPLFAFFVLAQGHKNIIYSVVTILIILVSFVFFLRSHQKYILKDGSNALAMLGLIAIDVIVSQFLFPKHVLFFGLSLSSILSILLLPIVGAGIYLTQKSSKT